MGHLPVAHQCLKLVCYQAQHDHSTCTASAQSHAPHSQVKSAVSCNPQQAHWCCMYHFPIAQALLTMSKAAIHMMPHHGSQSLALTLAAFSALGCRHTGISSQLLQHVAPRAKEFQPRHLATIVHALAAMRVQLALPVLDALLIASQAQSDLFEAEDWCNLCWGLAQMSSHGCSDHRCAAPLCQRNQPSSWGVLYT
jgi:hypothetical protein